MDLSSYINIIKNSGVVAFPTETVYGLGASAWDAVAVKKIFEIKGRPPDNPLIVHISSKEQATDFASYIPPSAQLLMDTFWPGPLSIILPKKSKVLDLITAGLATVALRMPDHPVALSFISQAGPLAAPSANRSGRPSPTKAAHVKADFGDDFPVVESEAARVGLESTVVDLSGDVPVILRPGSISRRQLEQCLQTSVEEFYADQNEKPRSPGQKYSHYKPEARVRWLDDNEPTSDSSTLYVLVSRQAAGPNILAYENDLKRMAAELYDRFRQADIEGFKTVAIESFSDKADDIAAALYNRISKAVQ